MYEVRRAMSHPFQQELYLPVWLSFGKKDRGYGDRNDTDQL